MTYDILSERSSPEVRVRAPADVIPLLKRYVNKRQEHFLVLTLNGGQQVIRVHIVTIGTLNRTLIHPREVFVRAIKDHAASLILAHNHPSGNVEPSREDQEATGRLVRAGSLLGIEVLDHLIFGGSSYFSFREAGTIPFVTSYKGGIDGNDS
jgi:DNA repair protein RadC